MSAHLRKRLAQLDARIIEQKRVLDQLQQTRSDVQRELHAVATYPILTLPTEITGEIFGHCRPVFGSSLYYLTYKASAPIVLSAVCRAWRDIALATPILWSELDIQPDDFPGIHGLVDRWFTHAGNHRLSLGLRAYTAEMVGRLREVVHRWSPRVEYIRLDIHHHDIHLLRLDSAAFPLLKGATLYCTYGQDPSDLPRNVFGNAPQLHDLRLLSYQVPPFTIPWLQLTKFEGVFMTLELLTLAPNLIEVSCSFVGNYGGPSVMITHRSLRSLTIGKDDEYGLSRLTLPALQHLDVSNMDFEDYESLVPFLARAAPPLVSLSIL